MKLKQQQQKEKKPTIGTVRIHVHTCKLTNNSQSNCSLLAIIIFIQRCQKFEIYSYIFCNNSYKFGVSISKKIGKRGTFKTRNNIRHSYCLSFIKAFHVSIIMKPYSCSANL